MFKNVKISSISTKIFKNLQPIECKEFLNKFNQIQKSSQN